MFDRPEQAPRATYRVQLHNQFDLVQAAGLAAYLKELGISHFYSSPLLQAAAGSTHGYDVMDHSRVNDELGGEKAFDEFCDTLGRHDLQLLLDIVPNHMSIAGSGNAWWWDVLENGQASNFAHYFDVDWSPPEAKLKNRVLIPILGDHYGRVIEAGEIQLFRDGGRFILKYFDHTLPVAPRSIDDILHNAAARAESDELAFIADSYHRLPLSWETDRAKLHARHRDKVLLQTLLERLCANQPYVAEAIDEVVLEFNDSADELDVLLERQNYRLAFWRTARDELDYRRFFDVNFLMGLRTEDERVFYDTHARVLEWVAEGRVTGLRIDHPDGLRDPEGYFERLRSLAPKTWIVVEKILMTGERLPASWPVEGTTGYDFVSRLAGVMVDPAGEQSLSEFYGDFTGEPTDYAELVRKKKLLALDALFGADQTRLAELFSEVCERHRRYRDYTRRELRLVLREAIACMSVYRTYIRGRESAVSETDSGLIEQTIEMAKKNRPDLDPELFDFLRDILLLRVRGGTEHELVMQFQQQTGPVMAKGVEDTTFYNYNRLVALNEVGGDPGRWSTTVAEFHGECQFAREHHPYSLLATTTHDTKRSEDVRARLYVLSECPGEWAAAVREWSAMNEPLRRDLMPDRNTEYLIYQTLVGAWPIDCERMTGYVLKAIREAKAHTSWTQPNEKFEEAVAQFVKSLFDSGWFLEKLERFVDLIREAGRVNSLSAVLLKITTPGVPDIYQGMELWEYSLVDPDNRRPVDYEARRRLLAEARDLNVEQVMKRAEQGLPKLWVTRRGLAARRNHSEWLGPKADYRGLYAEGMKAEHVVAFVRGEGAVTVAPRLPLKLAGKWEDTTLELPEGRWLNELTGETVDGGRRLMRELLGRFPVGLFTRL